MAFDFEDGHLDRFIIIVPIGDQAGCDICSPTSTKYKSLQLNLFSILNPLKWYYRVDSLLSNRTSLNEGLKHNTQRIIFLHIIF